MGKFNWNTAEWSPHMAPQGSLSDKETQQYRQGRDAAYAELGKLIGGNILLIE
jgi:hypothetical protein